MIAFRSRDCCGQKVDHKTKRNAAQVAAWMRRRYRGQRFTAYVCPWCRGWHVGHTLQPDRPKLY